MSETKKEKIVSHFREHKQMHIGVGVGLGVATLAGITYLIVRDRYEALVPDGAYGSKTADTSITMRPLSIFSSQNNIVNVEARNGRGHPGYIVRCLETGDYFTSQREAAAALNVSETILSKHLSGKIQDAEGFHLERLVFQ